MLKLHFKTVKRIKPSASRSESGEMYLLSLGYKMADNGDIKELKYLYELYSKERTGPKKDELHLKLNQLLKEKFELLLKDLGNLGVPCNIYIYIY